MSNTDVTEHRKAEVLIAIESLGGGGAERVALDLARHWPRDHAQPVLVVAERRGEYLADVPPDVEVLEVGVSSSPRKIVPFFRSLRQVLRGRPVLGVVSHMTGMNRMMLRASLAGLFKAPVVVVEHNDFMRDKEVDRMPWLRSFLLRKETGFLYRRARAVVGCSQGVARQIGALFRVPSARLHGIANPLDLRFLQEAPMDSSVAAWFEPLARPIFVSAGRMVPQKGFEDLLRAFALQVRGTLVILGDGPLHDTLENLAADLGVVEKVMMPGFIHAPQQVLQASDVYVSAALWDGYPLTLIEAYASGLPVVARACNFGPEEIVTPNRPGRLVRSLDIAELADAMAEAASAVGRFAPGHGVDLKENDPLEVALRYRALFPKA